MARTRGYRARGTAARSATVCARVTREELEQLHAVATASGCRVTDLLWAPGIKLALKEARRLGATFNPQHGGDDEG